MGEILSVSLCPKLEQFQVAFMTQSELSSLTSLKAWGSREVQKQHCFSPNLDWGVHSRGQSVQPCHDVGTPLPSQGFYHGGGS